MIAAWVRQCRRPVRADEVPPWLLPLVGFRGLFVLTAIAAIGCIAAAWALQSQRARIAGIREQRIALAAVQSAAQASVAAPSAEPDFTYQLPVRPDIALLVGELQRSASGQGVVILELQSRTSPATEQQLAQAELTAQMRGTYPGIKQVVWEVQARYPHATVRHLSLRRNTSPQDIQAEVALVLWGQPLRKAGNTAVQSEAGDR